MRLILGTFWATLILSIPVGAGEGDRMMNENWFETRPICFGRYVANVPKILHPYISDSRLDGFTITNLGTASSDDLAAKIRERKELMRIGEPLNQNVLQTQFLYRRNDQGVTILAYERPPIQEYYPPNTKDEIEAYFLSGGYLFQIQGQIDKETRDAQLANLFKIAHATRPRDMEEVPVEAGYCIQDGFVALPKSIRSDFSSSISLANEVLDETFRLNIATHSLPFGQEKQYDWPRSAEARKVAGFDGIQAWGASNEDYPGRRGYKGEYYAYLRAQGDQNNREFHSMVVRESVAPHEPSFSIDIARRFFDLVLDSARLR